MANDTVTFNGERYSYANRTYTTVRTGENHEEGTDMFKKIDKKMFNDGLNSLGDIGNIPMDELGW